MQEGESELGGLKIPHGNTTPPTPTPGPQPVGFETLQNTQNTPSTAPTISATPVTQSSPQSFIPNNTTEKETNSTDLASQTPTPQSTQPVQPLQPSARSPQPTSQAPFSPQPFPTQPSQPFIDQPTPAAASDILLSPTPTKKFKKWPTIAAVSTVTFLIIGLGVWLFINFSSNSQNTQARYIYNQYANYVINGTESSDIIDINSYPDLYNYALYDIADPVEVEDVISISKAVGLFESFKDLYITDNASDQEIINDCYNNLSLLSDISANEINTSSFIRYVVEADQVTATKEIEAEYEKFNSLGSPNASEYASARKNFEESLLDLFSNMDASICFTTQYELNSNTCLIENLEDYILTMSTNKAQLWGAVETIKENIITDTVYLYNLVNDLYIDEENDSEEEEIDEYEEESGYESEDEDEES